MLELCFQITNVKGAIVAEEDLLQAGFKINRDVDMTMLKGGQPEIELALIHI